MTLWFLSPSLRACEDRKDSNLFACLASWAGFHSSTSSGSHSSCSVVRAADFAFNLAKDIVSVRREPRKGVKTTSERAEGCNGEWYGGTHL